MSTPLFQQFDPRIIPWQKTATDYFESFDYSKGVLEMFFSGSIGSAKTIEHIHLIVRHCLENAGARYLMTRRVLKDLKRTSWAVLLKHCADIPQYIQSYNISDLKITFVNGSEIIGDSYEKGDYEKFRSLELSGADFEEANEASKEAYEAIKMRVGRLPNVKQNIITARCNPDEPSHWLFKYFIQDTDHPCKKLFYSITEDNPFLPDWYIENLRKDFDPLMARRMLRGEWLSIRGKNPYYAYDTSKQFLKNESYEIDPRYPLDIFHDFNIGEGKPMSAGFGQVINGTFHIARDFIVEGFNTEEIVDEMIDSGCFENVTKVRIFGDRNGKNNDTRGNKTDYDLIKSKLQKFRNSKGGSLRVEMQVPNVNPPIRARQNIVNAYCLNDNNEIRLFVYKDAETSDEGLRLTKLKKGSSYQEDDKDKFQHITTAIGYYVHYYVNSTSKIGTLKPTTGRR
jgi:PBSX family phage terminase large subunit